MRVESNSQLEIGDKNAYTIHSHAGDPEADVFAVSLHGVLLIQHV